jgi:hypothetical protein
MPDGSNGALIPAREEQGLTEQQEAFAVAFASKRR